MRGNHSVYFTHWIDTTWIVTNLALSASLSKEVFSRVYLDYTEAHGCVVMTSVQALSRDSLLASSALVAFLNGGHLILVLNYNHWIGPDWLILFECQWPIHKIIFRCLQLIINGIMNQGGSHFWHWTWDLSEMPGAKCWLTLQTTIHQLGGGFHCFLPIMIKKMVCSLQWVVVCSSELRIL